MWLLLTSHGRAGTSQHHLVLYIECSGWDKECCHEVLKRFCFHPVVSVTIQTWEPVFKLKQCLGKRNSIKLVRLGNKAIGGFNWSSFT